MQILFISDDYGLGGIQKVSTELGTMLSREHDVCYFSIENKGNYYGIPRNKYIKNNTLEVKNKWIKKIIKSPRIFEQIMNQGIYTPHKYLIKTVNNIILTCTEKKIDLLIVNGPLATSLIGIIKKKIPQLKIIAWQHNSAPVYLESYARKYLKSYINGLNKADIVICLTQKDKDVFGNFNTNTHAIYNPLTITTNRISKLTNKNICFVGRISIFQKGIDMLCEIATHVEDDWKIFIAGDGDKKEVDKLTSLIKENNLSDTIVWMGALKNNELKELYEKSSILISTSRWEGFGLTLTEAMNFGLPIIAFDNYGPNEILGSGEYGILVENNNVAEFVKQLNRLIYDINLRKFYQYKSLMRVADFQSDKIYREWECLFQRYFE